MAKINNRLVIVDSSVIRSKRTIFNECELLGIYLPRFCYHDELSIVGNCRMCLVETNISAKPVVACGTVFSNKIEVFTDSIIIKKARENVLEFLLINHPLDCPICDQGGECDLQDQTIIFGSDRGRFIETKRSVEDKQFSPLIKAIMTRCIHCTRCVRYADEIMMIPLLGTLGRGMFTEIGTYISVIFNSKIIGNIADLCPVGALTFSPIAYLYRAWELIGIDTIDTLDALCSNIRIDVRGNTIIRILPRLNPRINGEWITDDIRMSYNLFLIDRLCFPMYRSSIKMPFIRCSWMRAFNIISTHVGIEFRNTNKFTYFLGSGVDLYSTTMLKYLACVTALDNICPNFNMIIDDRTEFILDLNYLEEIQVQLFFMIGVNPQTESPILNIKLKRVFGTSRALSVREQGGILFAGVGTVLNYKLEHFDFGCSLSYYLSKGNRFYCTDIKLSENCYYLKGESLSFFSETINRATYIAYKILEKKGIRINFLSRSPTTLGIFEDAHGALNRSKSLFIMNSDELPKPITIHMENSIKRTDGCIFILSAEYFLKFENSKTLYDNKYIFKKIQKVNNSFICNNRFCVYIGPYAFLAEYYGANIVLPTKSFVEKTGSYLNLFGFIQQTSKAVRLPISLWSNEWIILVLSLFLSKFHPHVFCLNMINSLFNKIKQQQLKYRKLPEQMPLQLVKKYYMIRRKFGLPERHSYNPIFDGEIFWARRLDMEIMQWKAFKENNGIISFEGWLVNYVAYQREVYKLYRQWQYPNEKKRVMLPSIEIINKMTPEEFDMFRHVRVYSIDPDWTLENLFGPGFSKIKNR